MSFRLNFILCIFGLLAAASVFAEQKVYVLDSNYAITANCNDWEFSKKDGVITGTSKGLPISFEFFSRPYVIPDELTAREEAKRFFSNYAEENNVIFNGITNHKLDYNRYSAQGFIQGEKCNGRAAFYMMGKNDQTYYVFITSDVDLDNETARVFFDRTLALITPLTSTL